MSYIFVGYSVRKIHQRLQQARAGIDKLNHYAARVNRLDMQREYNLSEDNDRAKIKMPDPAEVHQAKKIRMQIETLRTAQRLIEARNTYFQNQIKSRMGFFKSFIPGTKENQIRRDLSNSISIFKTNFSEFTKQVQEFTNVGIKSKL